MIILHYVIAIIMIIAGIMLTCYELLVVISWFRAELLDAVIVNVEPRLGGILLYHYDVCVDKLPQRLTQKVRPLNPLKYFFPRQDVGKNVCVRYDKRKGRLVQHLSFGIVYLAAGLVLLAVGMLMLAVFWLVP